jgi:hypothetical protein
MRRRAQEVDRENHTWGNYIMCAYKGVHEHLARAARPAPPLVGLQLLVEGRVPQGAPGGPCCSTPEPLWWMAVNPAGSSEGLQCHPAPRLARPSSTAEVCSSGKPAIYCSPSRGVVTFSNGLASCSRVLLSTGVA